MTSSEGGFYSALDADSEGIEGKFYTWTYAELKEILGDELPAVEKYFQVTKEGNWEHGRNILLRPDDANVSPQLKNIRKKLLEARGLRVRPGTG